MSLGLVIAMFHLFHRTFHRDLKSLYTTHSTIFTFPKVKLKIMNNHQESKRKEEDDERTPLLASSEPQEQEQELLLEQQERYQEPHNLSLNNNSKFDQDISVVVSHSGSAANSTENAIILSTTSSSSSSSVKCWACWESTSSYRNPLIRVCRHCKDPDLQYIHQNCINSYISSLPLPRRPRSPRVAQPGGEGGDGNQDGQLQNQEPPQQTVAEFLSQEEVLYDCTRCRDPYTVSTVAISPLEVIWQDVWMRSIAIVLLFGFLVMGSTLVVIAANAYWGQDVVLFSVWGIDITALSVAAFLTILGIGAGGSLMAAMWSASSGRTRLWVAGVRLGHEIEDEI
jgi:hypothetical protein